MSSIFTIFKRNLSTSSICYGKRNPRKWLLYNKAGHKLFKEKQRVNPDPDIPIHRRGTKPTGRVIDNHYVTIPEMIPELIVPNLEGCELKPYVSYQSVEVKQSEFTPQDLFNAVYLSKITKDWKEGKLDKDGNPYEPSEYELLTPEEARNRATRTGCDIFSNEIESSKN
ncbi:hypothetical protein PV325_007431 [Microctonus aethiopoides]|uniref:39S ribosomal protein L41, mitochondrial n=1 Tax=Microctonus aethiopoides TaxID=144406 RepID=A0AA39FL08_9HYME|nr:hypothetical protein PV325_007431 [Microctonus aethiopoides]KAK0171555.1 hypothetical protein PV328_004998 [Microctonus aethiopoides]